MLGTACLLIYGTDIQLLQTRRMVLASAGYQVSLATDPAALETSLAERLFALLILCHSLPLAETRRIVTIAPVRWPGLMTLSLVRGTPSYPQALLGRVGRLLATATPAGRNLLPAHGSAGQLEY